VVVEEFGTGDGKFMKIRKWFGQKDEGREAYQEYTLATMKAGFLVDYDLKTWEVIGCNTYDYDGYLAKEWELRCGDEVFFLERSEEDGKVYWTLSRRIEIGHIQESVIDVILAEEDPPEEIRFEERLYTAVESSAGLFYQGGSGQGREFIVWSYEAEGDRVLFISQWGEREFSAYEGEYVEEYQFTDILPGAEEG
jgi:hypothetical protein